MSLVFVYGTLKRGFGNHRVMERAQGTYVGPAIRTNAKLIHLGGFPGLIETNDDNDIVSGELYSVSEDKLYVLDALEGYRRADDDGMYVCRSRWVNTPEGEDREVVRQGCMAQLYVWNSGYDSDRTPFIKDGNFTG